MTTAFSPIEIKDVMFSKVPRFFSSPYLAIQEVIQNAYRATLGDGGVVTGNAVITITCAHGANPGTVDMTVTDNGRGIQDPGLMLSLAGSEWTSGVEAIHDPAGLGVCALLAHARRVTWQSAFGTLTVTGRSFFDTPEYRRNLLEQVDTETPREGTSVTLHDLTSFNNVTDLARYVKEAIRFYTGVSFVLLADQGVWSAAHVLEQVSVDTLSTVLGFMPRLAIASGPWWSAYAISDRRDYSNPDVPSLRSMESVMVAWAGHLIGVREEQLNSLRWTAPDGTRMSNFPFRALIVIHDLRLVTPELPARTQLIWDARTVETLSLAASALWPLYEKAVLDEVKSTVRGLTLGEDDGRLLKMHKRIRTLLDTVGVPESFRTALKEAWPYGQYSTTRLDFGHSPARHLRVLLHRDEVRVMAPHALIMRGADWLSCEKMSDVAGLVLPHDADRECLLADTGVVWHDDQWFPCKDVARQVYPLVVTPVEEAAVINYGEVALYLVPAATLAQVCELDELDDLSDTSGEIADALRELLKDPEKHGITSVPVATVGLSLDDPSPWDTVSEGSYQVFGPVEKRRDMQFNIAGTWQEVCYNALDSDEQTDEFRDNLAHEWENLLKLDTDPANVGDHVRAILALAKDHTRSQFTIEIDTHRRIIRFADGVTKEYR